MRRIVLIALCLPIAALAQSIAPKVLADGFAPGLWQPVEVGNADQPLAPICLASITHLVTQGRGGAGCQLSLLADAPDNAVIRYKCNASLSGRTEIRRDAAGIYTIHAQGLHNGHPFASHAEWRRTGAC